jgi:membrane fusion protein (multidrug efflux system)
MHKKMIWMLLITGLVFGAIFGFKSFGKRMMNQSFDTMPMPAVTVASAVAESQVWPRVLQSVGTLVARNGTRIAPEIEGIVSAISFDSGQEVAAGQVLVELESSVELARVAALQAQLKLALLERARYQDLADRQLSARSELDLRISQADQLQAQIQAERALLGRKRLRAPFAGELGIRQISLGDYLKAGDVVVSLQSLDPIYLDFDLPERVLAEVAEGMEVSAELEAYPGRTFTGAIAAIEPEIDTGTRNFRLRAQLDNGERLLRPGAFARVRVQAGAPQAVLAVPQTAIRFEPYGNSVFVIAGAADQPRTARQRFVQTGATRGDLIAITEGLEPGDEVAISGLLKLRNGAQVAIDNSVRPDTDATPQPENR